MNSINSLVEKLSLLQELSRIPTNDGEQFIHVHLNLTYGESGCIKYGFNWKLHMGTVEFRTLDEAISVVKELKQKASPYFPKSITRTGKR